VYLERLGKLAMGNYYRSKQYRDRPDCIYEETADGTTRLKHWLKEPTSKRPNSHPNHS
jgi:hypothetical protein